MDNDPGRQKTLQLERGAGASAHRKNRSHGAQAAATPAIRPMSAASLN
jgi:hypothetical protein